MFYTRMGKVYIIIETDGKCENGKRSFEKARGSARIKGNRNEEADFTKCSDCGGNRMDGRYLQLLRGER